MKQLLILVFIFSSLASVAQKFEKEVRVKVEEVPDPAVEVLDAIAFPRKVKWYQEFGSTSVSFEAKSRKDKMYYSIEFSETGELEDVERKIKADQLPEATLTKIEQELSGAYLDYRIQKIQEQFTGDPKDLIATVRSNTPASGVTIRYELVIGVKQEKSFKTYEYLFSATGEVISVNVFVQKNADNIQF